MPKSTIKIELPKVRCLFCWHVWTPKKSVVKRCPKCNNPGYVTPAPKRGRKPLKRRFGPPPKQEAA